MMQCTRDLTTTLDGQVITLRAGLDRVGADHELYARHPEHFQLAPATTRSERGIEHRMISGGNGARRRAPMSLEEELRRRADRLAELDRRERQRPTPPSSEQRFWRDVSVLLGTDQAARADAREADLIDQVQALDKVNRRSAVDQLSHWLDEA